MRPSNAQHGVTLLELLVVISILAIVFAIGFAALPRDRIAVNQAVERFERDLQRARFNAISYNTRLVFVINDEAHGYSAMPESATAQRAGFEVLFDSVGFDRVQVRLGGPGAGVCSDGTGEEEWTFDARGVGRARAPSIVTFLHASTDFEVRLCVNAYGRVQRL